MTDHVVLVLPGRRYGPDLPLLRQPAQALTQLGAAVSAVAYPDLLLAAGEAPDDAQWQRAMRALSDVVADRVAGAGRVTLLAKSLGTRVLAHLPEGLLPQDARTVWLTPLFADPVTAGGAAAKPWRSLYVYGTADPACPESALREVVAATGGDVLAVAGGDHSLEVDGDPAATAAALETLTRAVVQHAGR